MHKRLLDLFFNFIVLYVLLILRQMQRKSKISENVFQALETVARKLMYSIYTYIYTVKCAKCKYECMRMT